MSRGTLETKGMKEHQQKCYSICVSVINYSLEFLKVYMIEKENF